LTIDAKRILAYSCPHAPYQHDKAFSFLKTLKQEYKPTVVVCLGDMCDLHAFSKWPKHPECYGAADEIKEAKEGVRKLADLFPRQLVCKSNHDERIRRLAVSHGMPEETVKTWPEVFKAPAGWKYAWEWEIGPALAIHGDRYSGKDGIRKAVTDNFCSTIMGHIHTEAGVFHQETKGGAVWGLQVGCLINPAYAAFEYQQTNRNRPLLGAGVVIDNVPHWVPLQ
jgi:metallophosphoesterase superfamily enzyme